MSTTQNVNLPVLPDWVQQHLRTLYGAQTDADFDTAFDAFVAPHARITLNGGTVSRAEYKKTIRGETQGEASATVTFNGVVSVLGEKQNKDGAVSGCCAVTVRSLARKLTHVRCKIGDGRRGRVLHRGALPPLHCLWRAPGQHCALFPQRRVRALSLFSFRLQILMVR